MFLKQATLSFHFSYQSTINNFIKTSMKNIIVSLLICCSYFPVSVKANEPLKQLLNDFISTDWPTVLLAKEKIENRESEGISEIIALMDNCTIYKLENTGDLIYPGADKFFGHGQIIDYDIDIACIRAGWILEEITFRNFGFTGIHLPAGELADFVRKTFPEYTASSTKSLDQMDESEKRNLIRKLSIENAKTWWQNSSRQWSRLTALEQALSSKDEKCQVKALFYLRNGRTICTGLNQKFYKTKLSKVINRLSNSETGRVSENAKLIMLDSDFSWLALKPVQ